MGGSVLGKLEGAEDAVGTRDGTAGSTVGPRMALTRKEGEGVLVAVLVTVGDAEFEGLLVAVLVTVGDWVAVDVEDVEAVVLLLGSQSSTVMLVVIPRNGSMMLIEGVGPEKEHVLGEN